jgi:hypothetical protein
MCMHASRRSACVCALRLHVEGVQVRAHVEAVR